MVTDCYVRPRYIKRQGAAAHIEFLGCYLRVRFRKVSACYTLVTIHHVLSQVICSSVLEGTITEIVLGKVVQQCVPGLLRTSTQFRYVLF